MNNLKDYNLPQEEMLADELGRSSRSGRTEAGQIEDLFEEFEVQLRQAKPPVFQAAAVAPPPVRNNLMMRFMAACAVAVAALALFVGYAVTRPEDNQVAAKASSDFQEIDAPGSANAVAAPTPLAALAKSEEVELPASVADTAEETDTAAALQTDRASTQSGPQEIAALTPPAESAAPPVPELDAAELAALMARGRQYIESGDVSSARPVLRRAAEAGYAEAALAMGETYDPQTSTGEGATAEANVDEARRWYVLARDMGSLEAPTRLERLPGD